ncbi:hypothetical protein SCHPADRAFT_105784 [Schizopora paradoxa]|uniref:F-box domain-containing protein n=1 Tax=Schizopora paradoxa TaxID=27342 RepID=A0A0H2SNN4_9AGAM|nr:hypothetical protein SCHPADRAFT_105784 [Schizopora paradoxa]
MQKVPSLHENSRTFYSSRSVWLILPNPLKAFPCLPQTTMSTEETTADSTVPQLPIDMFDAIASHLDRPADLLSLAITCKALAQVVLTRHIQYRDVALVQLDAKDEMIWNNLLAHPDRTANVRRLELNLRGCCPGLDGRTFIPSFTQLITLMRRLTYLKVYEPPDSTNIIVHSWELCWKILQSHNSLVTLEITIGRMMMSSQVLGFLQLRNLENVYLEYVSHSRHTGRHDRQTMDKMHELFTAFLIPNHSLVHISLLFPHMSLNIKSLLRDGTFPKLQGLRWSFRITSESAKYIHTFMERHPTIEILHWGVTSRVDAASLVSNTLPMLRGLSGKSNTVSAFLEDRSEAPRPLQSISNIIIDSKFWYSVRPGLDAERILRLEVEQFGCVGDIYRFAKEFPNLVWLRVDLSDMIWDDATQSLRTMKNAEWGHVLVHFPRLRVIRGIDFLEDPELPNENAERLLLLSNLMPNLQFLDHWSSSRHVVRIVRTDGSEDIRWEVTDAYYAEKIGMKQP